MKEKIWSSGDSSITFSVGLYPVYSILRAFEEGCCRLKQFFATGGERLVRARSAAFHGQQRVLQCTSVWLVRISKCTPSKPRSIKLGLRYFGARRVTLTKIARLFANAVPRAVRVFLTQQCHHTGRIFREIAAAQQRLSRFLMPEKNARLEGESTVNCPHGRTNRVSVDECGARFARAHFVHGEQGLHTVDCPINVLSSLA